MTEARVLAVIPARGGSKGVPRKNIRPLAGKPLIAYSILAAQAAQRVDRLLVSTDDEEIASVAREWGADVPFLRPPELSDDRAAQIDVVIHALQQAEALDGCRYSHVILLQPTAPLRTAEEIDASLQMLLETGCDAVVSYTPVESAHPFYMVTLDGDRPRPLLDVPADLTARQQYPAVYRRNGAIYATRREVILARSFYGEDVRAYIMPPERSINIDSLFDFDLAEFLLSRR